MSGYSYVDIFDTKGIEYLVVIAFLLVIVPIWIAISKPVKVKTQLLKSVSGLSAKILSIPKGLFYSKNHTWTYLEKTGTVKVGVDDLLLHITGGVSVDFIKENGDQVAKGELIAKVSREGKELGIKSPVSGIIQGTNSRLKGSEGVINKDPYGKGWMCRVKPEHWKEEMNTFMLADEAEEWTANELLRCKDFVASSSDLPEPVLQDGGELTDFPLADLSSDMWSKFQKEFLD